MRIGVAREIKLQEHRVALTPAGARELVQRGHDVLVEEGAGLGSAFADDAYERAGAAIVSVDDVWERSELLLKVKEPIALEYPRLRPGLTLFTYLHIAADEPLDASARRLRDHRNRVRDGRDRSRRPAAARADERDRRPARPAGRGALPREAEGRARDPARRRGGSRAGRGSSSSAAGWSATTPQSSRSGWARR